ncbi:MFS transporter [Sphingosinicella sp. BN140058]|nr:MFS transporter [Sphingosinicella sp. BN140058]
MSGALLIAGILLASLTEAIAGTVLALAKGDISGDIHATPDEFALLDVSYTASKLAGFALAPWLVTRVDPVRLLLAATLTMGLSSAVSAGASGLDTLVMLRLVQGLSGGVLLVSGQAILFWLFPASRQPLVQALFAIGAVVAPAALAPAVQAWLLDSSSWNWIFLAILPVALLAAGLLLIADTPPTIVPRQHSMDWLSFASLTIAMAGATYLLSQGNRWDWFEASRMRWAILIVATSFGFFLVRQHRERAVFDTRVFKVDDFTFAFVVSFVAGAALFGSAFLIPAFALSVLGFTASGAGELLLPSGGLFVASLLLAGGMMQARRIPPIATVPFGIAFIMAAMWLLSGSTLESGAEDLMPALLLRGLGLGFLFLSITLIAFGRLEPASLASGIGLFNIGRQLGGLIGVAGLQTLISQQSVANTVVLGAGLSAGTPALAERLAATSSLLVSRGMDAVAASTAARAMLGRATMGQATVIAFDTAFNAVALLFVAAAPVIIGVKIGLSRAAASRRRRPGTTGEEA